MRRDGKPSLGSDMDAPNENSKTENKTEHPEAQILPARTKLEMPPAVTDGNKPKEQKKHWLEYAKFGLEVLGFFVLCVYAYFTIQIYCANRKAADAAKSAADTAAAGLRPWIKITSVELRGGIGPIKTLMFHWPLTGQAVPPILQFKVSVTNIGKSVAQDVEVIPELFFGKFESDKWHRTGSLEQDRFCRSVMNRKAGDTRTIFPGDPFDWQMGVGGIIGDADAMPSPGGRRTVAGLLILCVNYRGGQTQSSFGLYENNSIHIPVGVDADLPNLRLIH